MTKKKLALAFCVAVSSALICAVGCSGDAASQPSPSALPSSSSIPAGIYSGRIDVDLTLWVDGVRKEENESRALTIVFDENGRFLDAGGVPFFVGGVYFLDVGNLFFEMFLRSITVIDNRIVLVFSLTAYGDVGTAQIEMTGGQTDTITFDAATGTLTLVRTQQYGGIGSDGAIVDVFLEANAILERG